MTQSATGSARRLEQYSKISVYGLLALQPLIYVGAFPGWGPTAGVFVGAVQAVISIVVCRRALAALRTGVPRPSTREWLALATWLAFSAVVLLVMVAQIPPDQPWIPLVAAISVPIGTVTLLLPVRTGLVLGVGIGGALGALVALRLEESGPAFIALAVVSAGTVAVLVLSFWLTGWMLRNIWELEDARRTAGQLAIAEERLRIARDLHDLFGRTMAAVAVKTELAGELVRRGKSDDALAQLGEVRVIAEQTGQQVRAVVQGYRHDDLTTELDGARALLDSAGIRCVVRGSAPEGLDPAALSALVWVLRESVTNVIRHSSASECLITIESGDGHRMIITNDGSITGTAPDRPRGNGVIGMRERAAELGGTLVITQEAGRHTVAVTVPTSAGARS